MEKTDVFALQKFRGPTFSAIQAFAQNKENSLIRVVESKTPVELAIIVVGKSVYEVLTDLPECEILIEAMQSMKRRQTSLSAEGIYRWMNHNMENTPFLPNGRERSMTIHELRMFMNRCPAHALPKSVFKAFTTYAINFLSDRLIRFNKAKMLFKRPPDLPQESKLPAVANALGPMERLQRDYPHLARLKHEMIVNIMHFAVTYCLDWVIELITMRVRRGGGIIYKFPPLGENGEVLYEENGAEIAPYRWQPPRAHDMQMPSSSDRQREAPPRRPDVPSTVDLPDVANQSRKDDEWEEMLRTSQNDPDLPKHYKTMIRCLVSTNRDLKKAIASYRQQGSS